MSVTINNVQVAPSPAPPEAKPVAEVKTSSYKRWYDKNKDSVAKRRKARYANDPDYREKVKALAAAQRRVLLTWDDVAEKCKAKLDDLKQQCETGLFPNPALHGDVEVFTMPQAEYVKQMQTAIRKYGKHSQEVGDISSLAYANWS